MTKSLYKFTVFTPSFNRGNKLKNIYKSLLNQTYQDFEWLIVDDGSTDNTKDIIETWRNERKLQIRYFYRDNGGKHRAFNQAIKEAKGEWLICLDSDDIYTTNALEILHRYSLQIEKNDDVVGMPCLSMDPIGNIIGSRFPKDAFITNHFDLYYKHKINGDKGLIYKTKILKKYYFPEFKGENFLTEAIVLNRIARSYNICCVNHALQIVEYQTDGLSNKIKFLRTNNPKGFALYHNERSYFKLTPIDRLINGSLYIKYSLMSGNTIKNIFIERIEKKQFFIRMLLGIILFLRNKTILLINDKKNTNNH